MRAFPIDLENLWGWWIMPLLISIFSFHNMNVTNNIIMIKELLSTSRMSLIGVCLTIGFVGGVIFTVYTSPSIVSQVAEAGLQDSSQADIIRHVKHLEESVAEDPSNVEAWAQLAETYYELREYPKSIVAYLKLATLADEKSDIYLDLGVVYRRDGQFEKSIESFDKALNANPENIQALFNIGVVQYHDLDDEPAAVTTWEKVAAMKPDFQLSTGQTIQQLLEKLK